MSARRDGRIVCVVISEDGTVSATGPFMSRFFAQRWLDEHPEYSDDDAGFSDLDRETRRREPGAAVKERVQLAKVRNVSPTPARRYQASAPEVAEAVIASVVTSSSPERRDAARADVLTFAASLLSEIGETELSAHLDTVADEVRP